MRYKYWKSVQGGYIRFYRSYVKSNAGLPLHSKSSIREVVRAAAGREFEWRYLFDLPVQYACLKDTRIMLEIPLDGSE